MSGPPEEGRTHLAADAARLIQAPEKSHEAQSLTSGDCRRLLAALNVLETERLAAEWGAQIAEMLGERVLARGGG